MSQLEYYLTPICSRVLLKALCACYKHSDQLCFNPFRRNGEPVGAVLSSIDTAGVSIMSFEFDHVFFSSIHELGYPEDLRQLNELVFNSRVVSRAFRNVSPNRIQGLKIILQPSSMSLTFLWKNGIKSSRKVEASDPSENIALIEATAIPSGRIPRVILSLSPRYLSDLLGLVPDNPQLWALTISHERDENISRGSVIRMTNSTQGVVDTSALVGLTITQAELNRNSSYFVPRQLPIGYSFKLPLTELKSIASLAADDTLKESFSILFGFSHVASSFGDGAMVITVHAANTSATDPSPVRGFSIKLWSKTKAPENTSDELAFEELNIDEIDPPESAESRKVGGSFVDEEEDALFVKALDELEHTPVQNSPFIVLSTDPYTAQQSSLDPIPEWEDEIPSTPSCAPCRLDNFDDLWNSF
jgi:hypothetical protein